MRLLTKSVATLALVVSLGCTAANAGTYSYSNYSMISPSSVTLYDAKLGVFTTTSAGEIVLNPKSSNALATFCFDIQQVLKSAGSFTTGTFLTGAIGSSINALLSHVLPLIATDADASAALQIAIWKTEYGNDLSVYGRDTDVMSKASTYLDRLSSGTWKADATKAVAFLDGTGKNQSQIYLTAVPEPATLSILGLGVAGLVALRRRVTGKATPAFS